MSIYYLVDSVFSVAGRCHRANELDYIFATQLGVRMDRLVIMVLVWNLGEVLSIPVLATNFLCEFWKVTQGRIQRGACFIGKPAPDTFVNLNVMP